jgi:catechol 2,3-dioxygenase-like lactoylglutathione lyase family enzyme
MNITALDHLVLTVADVARSIDFYTRVLGMEAITFGEGRKALRFGSQKINLHQLGAEVLPNAARATAGSADLCLLTDTPLPQVLAELAAHQIEAISDIVPRTGAVGAIESVYLRDPDGNLLEISRYPQP